MSAGWNGDFNGRGILLFALVCLLLPRFAPVVGSGGLRLNGTAGMGNGNAGIPYGRGDPDPRPQNRNGDRSVSAMQFTFTGGGGRSFHAPSKSPDREETGSSENIEDSDAKEGSEGGILGRIHLVESDGSRLAIPGGGDADSNAAVYLAPSVAVWPDAKGTMTELGESGVQDMSWNASSSIRNDDFGTISRLGGHIKHNSNGSDNSGLPSTEKNQTNREQRPNYDPHQPVIVPPSMSSMVVVGDKEASRSEADAHMASDDMIFFPDELEEYDEEESDDGSPVGIYFFIQAPLRNRTRMKCGPNQRFFRGRCRTYNP